MLVRADDPDWKEFVGKPSLKYILRALAGLAEKHAPTQLAVSEASIPILHHMEQVSSDEHIGSLAEAVLESLGCWPAGGGSRCWTGWMRTRWGGLP